MNRTFRGRPLFLFVLGPALHIEVVAVAVVDDRGGEIFHAELVDGLGAQLGEGYNLGLFDGFRQQRAGAADVFFFILSITAGLREPFPIMPFRPMSIRRGA